MLLGPLMLLLLLLLPPRLGFVPSDAATAARGMIETPSLLSYLGRWGYKAVADTVLLVWKRINNLGHITVGG